MGDSPGAFATPTQKVAAIGVALGVLALVGLATGLLPAEDPRFLWAAGIYAALAVGWMVVGNVRECLRD